MALLTNGLTLSFGTSSWTGEITGFSGLGAERPFIDTSHLTTDTWRTMVAAPLVALKPITFTFLADPDSPPPIDAAEETITITFRNAGATAATAAFTGGISDYEISGEEGGLLTGSVTVQPCGEITFTPGT